MIVDAFQEVIGDADGNRLHLRFEGSRHAAPEGAPPHLVGQAVHRLLQLDAGLAEGRKYPPSLEVQSPPLARSFQASGVQYEGAAVEGGDPGTGLPLQVLAGAVDGGPSPWVVVNPPDGPPPTTLALEQADESSFELFAGAGVDDGVHAAVEVAEPEDNLEGHS